MSIEQYIKERIKIYQAEQNDLSVFVQYDTHDILSELQAVLSKIEEIQRQEFEKIVQVNYKS